MERRRIAVVDRDRCNPKKCGLECVKFCPRVRAGEKETIQLVEGLLVIDEQLCVGCGICARKCPFQAISVVNLPAPLEGLEVHRYGVNGFVLFRLPIVRMGSIVGLVGPNGIGKTTIMRILAGELIPNLGDPSAKLSWDEVIQRFRGTEVQNYLEKLSGGQLRAVHKPERIDLLPKAFKGTLREALEKADERGVAFELAQELGLSDLMDRSLFDLSGGELQRVAVIAVASKDADVYMFDEPCNFLDVFQRMKVAAIIRRLAEEGKGVMVIEHDLAVLDYLSDYVHILYGVRGVFGVVSLPHGTREGINIFLGGYLPDDNVRFRDYGISFSKRATPTKAESPLLVSYSALEKVYDSSFRLKVEPGELRAGEVVVAVGPNGIGKTTFVAMLAGALEPTSGEVLAKDVRVAYKPQYVRPEHDGTVYSLLKKMAGSQLTSSFFRAEVLHRLEVEGLMDRRLSDLSGGELQRVAVAAVLGMDADIFLLDEPSAFLDVEMRLALAKAIRRRVEGENRAAIVVEHDLITIEALADRIILFSGQPGVEGHATPPLPVEVGMNEFLKAVGITFRRDPRTGRPRVNKPGSKLDVEARASGRYYV